MYAIQVKRKGRVPEMSCMIFSTRGYAEMECIRLREMFPENEYIPCVITPIQDAMP